MLSLLKASNNANGSVTPDFSLFGHRKYTLIGDSTIGAPNNLIDGQIVAIELYQANSNQYLVFWDSSYLAPAWMPLPGGAMPQGQHWQGIFYANDGRLQLMSGAFYT